MIQYILKKRKGETKSADFSVHSCSWQFVIVTPRASSLLIFVRVLRITHLECYCMRFRYPYFFVSFLLQSTPTNHDFTQIIFSHIMIIFHVVLSLNNKRCVCLYHFKFYPNTSEHFFCLSNVPTLNDANGAELIQWKIP